MIIKIHNCEAVMKRKVEYRDYYIAYLDVLGFSNIVKEKDADFIHNIFNNIKEAKKFVSKDRGGAITEETQFYFFFRYYNHCHTKQ